MTNVKYGPAGGTEHLAVHKFTDQHRTTDGRIVWKSACGQVALYKERLYATGVPLDAIRRHRCGNCFRGS